MRKFLYRLGSSAAKHPLRIVLLWLVLAAGVLGARGAVGGEPVDTFNIPGAESQAAVDLIEARFPGLTGTTSRVVFHADDGNIGRPPLSDAVRAALGRIAALPEIGAVSDPFDPAQGAVSADGSTAYATLHYSVRFDALTIDDLDALRAAAAPAEDAGLQVEVGGAVDEFGDQETAGKEGIGLLVAVLVLVVALGAVTAMVLPIGLALFSLTVGTALLGLLAAVADVPADTTTLATMIGLGVGIDYALFVLTRYRQLVASGHGRHEAIARANATAGHAVVFAGATVLVAILGLQASGIPAIAMMGYGTAVVLAVLVLAAVTLLPALLGAAGNRIDGLLARTRRRHLARAAKHDAEHTLAGRWAGHVARHPVRYAAVSLAFLVGVAMPAASLRIGFSDAGAESTDRTARRAYDLLAEGFGPGFNGPILAVADLGTAHDPAAAVSRLRDDLAATPGVAGVGQPLLSETGDAAIVTALPATAPQDERTGDLVRRIRNDVVPGLERTTGARVELGGSTATFEDISHKISSRLPWFIGAVVLLSVLLLMVLFRSVVVPVKAALMNLLSITAAYGVVVAIFQWGWGASLIGLETTVPINPFVPMMMFAILFGLSMDYEVFLLSRIREEYDRTHDNHRSVVVGLSSTARVITSAAIIMVAVFGGFVTNPATFVKMIGVGLAAAVLVDATVIRMILVPAAMTLMGRANWWLPRWLDRRLPTAAADETDPAADDPTGAQPVAA
jgi:putative drug exporter of the RND superfamily